MSIVLHPNTNNHLEQILAQPPQALIIAAPDGGGKDSIAYSLISRLLQVDITKLENEAALRIVSPKPGEPFGIDQVRQIQHFMTSRTPKSDQLMGRIAYLPQAHTMTPEAQNALLKLLEEPPERSMIILSANNERNLLQTIVSRSQVMHIIKPPEQQLIEYFTASGHEPSHIHLALRVGGGLPGLTATLLQDNEHPLSAATTTARQLLGESAFARLAHVDALSKKRDEVLAICYVLQQMAHVALLSSSEKTANKWQRILIAAYDCQEAIQQRANAKLALTQLMLTL